MMTVASLRAVSSLPSSAASLRPPASASPGNGCFSCGCFERNANRPGKLMAGNFSRREDADFGLVASSLWVVLWVVFRCAR